MARPFKTVKCAKHYVVKPGGTPYVMERIPSLKNIKEADAKVFGVKLYRRKKDKFGRPIPNLKDYIQPFISAAMARENIFVPNDPICNKCKACVTG